MTMNSKAQTFVDAWLKYRDDCQLSTDKHASAFCLMIEQTLARNADAAEVHACELQDVEQWDNALIAGEHLQSHLAAERAAHPHLEGILGGVRDKAAVSLGQHPVQRQLERIGRDLEAIRLRIESI